MPIDIDALHALAGEQFGVFTRDQARTLGASKSQITRRVSSGAWIKQTDQVLSLPGAPDSWEKRLWTTHLQLGPESKASHRTALLLGGVTGPPPEFCEFTVPTSSHLSTDAVLHQISDHLPHHVTTHLGLPTTTLARTFVDLSTIYGWKALLLLVDQALDQNLVRPSDIRQVVADVMRPGKPGMRRVGAVLSARSPTDDVPMSHLKRHLDKVIRMADLPRGKHQYPLPTDHSLEGFVDRAYPEAKLIIEADGRAWHKQERRMEADRQRDRAAATQGWATIRFMHDDLVNNDEGSAREMRSIYDKRLAVISALAG